MITERQQQATTQHGADGADDEQRDPLQIGTLHRPHQVSLQIAVSALE